MAKVTTNIRFRIIAPYGFSKKGKDVSKLLSDFFKSRGNLLDKEEGKKYILTSYRFLESEAEIKFKINYDKIGNLRSIDLLGTFDCYRKYITNNIDEYKNMIDGFVEYLRSKKDHWYVDVFVFRIIPVDFKRQFLSRAGENIKNVYVNLVTDKGYCILKGDRLEYRVNIWDDDVKGMINNLLRRYTRK